MNNKTKYAIGLLAVLASGIVLTGCSEESTQVKNGTTTSVVKKTDSSELPTWLNQFVQNKIAAPEGLRTAEFSWGEHDLNQDGQQDYLVIMNGMYFCGSGGCTAFLINKDNGILQRFTLMSEPVYVSGSRHHGWQDMVVYSNNAWRQLTFNGKKYQSNPSMAPTIDRTTLIDEASQAVKASKLYQANGKNLQPIWQKGIFKPYDIVDFSFQQQGDPKQLYTVSVQVKNGKAKIMQSNHLQK